MKAKGPTHVLLCCALLGAAIPMAAQVAHDSMSPYAGEDAREIPTLSEDDVRQLANGEGWGLAKAAELNGMPGPAHLLEMAEQGEIHLSDDQLERVRRLHREMKERAIPLGRTLIEQERELNRRFAASDLREDELRALLAGIAETTAELRYVHLATHLKTLPVLSAHQVRRYNTVRGYTAGASGDHTHSSHGHNQANRRE